MNNFLQNFLRSRFVVAPILTIAICVGYVMIGSPGKTSNNLPSFEDAFQVRSKAALSDTTSTSSTPTTTLTTTTSIPSTTTTTKKAAQQRHQKQRRQSRMRQP